MSTQLLQAIYDTNPPERIERARQEIRCYSPEARAELDAETSWLLERHPVGLTRAAAGYVAWVRLRSGLSRHDQPARDAVGRLWVDEGRRRRSALLRLLAQEAETHGDNAFPFRRDVEWNSLGGIQGQQYRAFLDVVPRGLWDFALDEAAAWTNRQWGAFDGAREELKRSHPWLVAPEPDAVAWAEVSGDFHWGLSGPLLFLAAHVALIARKTGRNVLDVLSGCVRNPQGGSAGRQTDPATRPTQRVLPEGAHGRCCAIIG